MTHFKSVMSAIPNELECTYIVDKDSKPGKEIFKIKFDFPFPEDRFSKIAVHVCEDLRSSLDLAAYDTAIMAGHGDPKSAYFPFGDSVTGIEKTIKGRCKQIPPDIVTLFRSFKPYKGGDDLLWALNQLCGGSKHRFVTLIMDTGGAGSFRHSNIIGPDAKGVEFPRDPAVLKPGKNEIELFTHPVGTDVHGYGQFAVNITFSEKTVLPGQDVIAVCDALGSKVEGIISATEARAKEIGLF